MNRIFYHLGILFFAGMLIVVIVTGLFGREWIQYLPKCYFHEVTGFYCPGCGGTRAVIELLELHIWKSFLYHPFVIYGITTYFIFMSQYMMKKKPLRMDIVMYIGIVIIIGQWLLKNTISLVGGTLWL